MKSLRSSIALFVIFNLLFPAGLGLHNHTTSAGPVRPFRPPVQADQRLVGQAVTALPDGRVLLTGGKSGDRVLAEAVIRTAQGSTAASPSKLNRARFGHTATLLSQGQILLLGGLGPDGEIVKEAELVDPRTGQFQLGPQFKGTPRAFHTATVLTDGRLLIAGGATPSGNPQSIELWDSKTNTVETLTSSLQSLRAMHSATLLPDGTVLLWGGVDDQAQSLQQGEIFDPASGSLIPTFDASLATAGSQSSPGKTPPW